MANLLDLLNTLHPLYAAETPRWQRYRAFGEGIDTAEEKMPWLPQGIYESKDAYNVRLRLTHDLGQSPAALLRVKGALFRGEVTRDYSKTSNPDAFAKFDAQAGGVRVTIENLLEQSFEEAAKMGLSLVFVGRKATPGATNAAQEALPFCEIYQREEAVDWDVDAVTGTLNWVTLKRTVSRRGDAMNPRADETTWLVCDRMSTRRFVAASATSDPVQQSEDIHALGIVPVALHYGIRLGVMDGRSYVDALSRADLRRLGLESGNAHAAHLHGSPRLVVKSRKAWDQIPASSSRVLVLDTGEGEDASYLELDASGMDVVERMIESGDRQGAKLAGMDPGTYGGDGSGPAARSGAAMQWAFAASEGPTLENLYEGLVRADLEVHEIVARYFAPQAIPATTAAFVGVIGRAKQWDFMALGELLDAFVTAKNEVPSPTWRKEIAKQIAARAPGNLPAETLKVVMAELDAADFKEPPPAPRPIV